MNPPRKQWLCCNSSCVAVTVRMLKLLELITNWNVIHVWVAKTTKYSWLEKTQSYALEQHIVQADVGLCFFQFPLSCRLESVCCIMSILDNVRKDFLVLAPGHIAKPILAQYLRFNILKYLMTLNDIWNFTRMYSATDTVYLLYIFFITYIFY